MSWSDVEGKGDSTKATYVKFEEGVPVTIRILDEEPFSKWTHWLPASKRSIVCAGKSCPTCESIKAAKDAGLEPKFSSSRKFVIHVLNRNTGNVELLEQGKEFFEQLLTFKKNIGDLRTYDIKVIRTGKEKKTSYTLIPLPVQMLTQAETDAYLANKYDIPSLNKPYTSEQIVGLMEGKPASEVFGNRADEEIGVED